MKDFLRFKYSLLSLTLLLTAAIISCTSTLADSDNYFPDTNWETVTDLEAAGWSEEGLQAAREATDSLDTATMMIIHRGRVVDSWGDLSHKYRSHSLRKSLLSAMYGIQVAEGTIDLDATLEDLGIDDHNNLSETEKQATVRMLLQARSGVYHPALYETRAMASRRPERHSHEPGANFYYNNWDFNALGTIYEQETGEKLFESFEERIARPIGMQDYTAEDGRYVTGDASIHAAYPFVISTRDLARFGLLFLNDGEWNGQQVLPEGWVEESTSSYSDAGNNGGYGYLWWVSVDGQHFSGVDPLPEGTYTGRGARGHVLAVIPDLELVIVHRTDTAVSGQRVAYGDIGRVILKVLDAYNGA